MKTQDAIIYFGSASKLAKALHITKQAVSAWGKVVPLGRAYQIEILTQGQLKASCFVTPSPSTEPSSAEAA